MPALSLSLFSASSPSDTPANILAAGRALAPHLARSRVLERRLVSATLTTCFGGTDAEGAWSWRDAYDACEVAVVLQARRLGAQVGRLEDAPAETTALLARLGQLCPTHTRRSEEQVALDQFSTPPALAALAVLAAQVRPGDRVLEPSAGTGLLAVVAEVCGAGLTLNEVSAHRAALLDGLFPWASRTRHDAAHLADLLPGAGSFDAAVCNPPFGALRAHLVSALTCLAEGGRLAAIVPTRAFSDEGLVAALRRNGALVGAIAFPERAFAKHGTSVETGLLVIDRCAGEGPLWSGDVAAPDDLAEAAALLSALPARPTARPRAFRNTADVTRFVPKARALASPGGRLAWLSGAAAVDYAPQAWSGEGHDVGLYQAYDLGRIRFPEARPHPSALVESGPMASVPLPSPGYRPVLPADVRGEGRLSDAQSETVVYAGEAHGAHLPGWWALGDAPHDVLLVEGEHPGAVRLRRGFFLGDGTGCGKGRQIAAVIADNMAQGRTRAVWLSRNDALLEDARRDWSALGGSHTDIVSQSAWKQSEAIRLDRGFCSRPTPRCASRRAATGRPGSSRS
jgi:predicted RNA methylase